MKFKGAIQILIIINIVIFAIPFLAPEINEKFLHWLALYFPHNSKFGYWQFVTTMFVHGGIMHILLNMYALWAFGSPLEYIWGKNRFLFFYFLSGIGAGVIYTLVNYYQFNLLYEELVTAGMSSAEIENLLILSRDQILSSSSNEKMLDIWRLFNIPVVGASGAIYGVLVAFGILFPNSKLMLIFLPFPIAAKYFIPILIAIDLFSGLTGFSIFGGGVAHFGHIGGAIIGFLIMLYWRNQNRHKDKRPPSSEAEIMQM